MLRDIELGELNEVKPFTAPLKMRLVNTVEMDFGKQPTLRMLTVHRWLRSLGVRDDQVYGIMAIVQTEAKIIRLKFREESDYKSFFDRYAGIQNMEGEDGPIQVTVREAGVREVYVRLMDVPFETTGEAIKSALQPYGTVLLVRREKYMGSTDNDYFQVLNGTVTAKMTLLRHVPSYLRISNERIVVRYPGQPATCMICSLPGHMAASCSARRGNNRFVGKWAEGTPQQTPHQGNTKDASVDFPSERVIGAKKWPTPAESVGNRAQKVTSPPSKEESNKEMGEKTQNVDNHIEEGNEEGDEEGNEERNDGTSLMMIQQGEIATQDLELSMVVLEQRRNPPAQIERSSTEDKEKAEDTMFELGNLMRNEVSEEEMDTGEIAKGGVKRGADEDVVNREKKGSKNKKGSRKK